MEGRSKVVRLCVCVCMHVCVCVFVGVVIVGVFYVADSYAGEGDEEGTKEPNPVHPISQQHAHTEASWLVCLIQMHPSLLSR
jgi:predicted membrane-bound mannosyltransferase